MGTSIGGTFVWIERGPRVGSSRVRAFRRSMRRVHDAWTPDGSTMGSVNRVRLRMDGESGGVSIIISPFWARNLCPHQSPMLCWRLKQTGMGHTTHTTRRGRHTPSDATRGSHDPRPHRRHRIRSNRRRTTSSTRHPRQI